MAFYLGGHKIDEILHAAAQDFSDNLLYTLSELSNANITISAESDDFTDKKGNVIRKTYRSKTGRLEATHAMLHPAAMNAGSGSDIITATAENPQEMPKILTIVAGSTVDVSDAKEGTVVVMGLYNNGANGAALTQGTEAVVDKTFALVEGKLTVPAAAEGAPIQYFVMYKRDKTEGIILKNSADTFPVAQRLTMLCSYEDPCDSALKSCYVYLPNFMPDPNMTINLDSANQEIDFNGDLNIDFCGTSKDLYYIYYPNEGTVVSGVVAAATTP